MRKSRVSRSDSTKLHLLLKPEQQKKGTYTENIFKNNEHFNQRHLTQSITSQNKGKQENHFYICSTLATI